MFWNARVGNLRPRGELVYAVFIGGHRPDLQGKTAWVAEVHHDFGNQRHDGVIICATFEDPTTGYSQGYWPFFRTDFIPARKEKYNEPDYDADELDLDASEDAGLFGG